MPPEPGSTPRLGDLGKGEGGRIRSEAEVARHAEFDANAEARALRRQHDRLLDLLHLVEEVVVGPQAVLTSDVRSADDALSALTERANKVRHVEAAGEVPPLGGDDQNPVAVIVGEVEHRRLQHVEHLQADRVALVVAREGHRDDAVAVVAPGVACRRHASSWIATPSGLTVRSTAGRCPSRTMATSNRKRSLSCGDG